MMRARRRGRPAGDKRQALASFLAQNSQFTMGQLVRCWGWSMADAYNTLRLAVDRGEVRVVDRVQVQGCKRPVALYATTQVEAPMQVLSDALRRWAS